MKNFFLSFVVAALFGLPFATARDATAVQVTVKQQAGKPVAVQKIGLLGNHGVGAESIMQQHKTGGWHVVNIPLEVEGYCKKKDENGNPLPVHYIPSLTVKVHLLFKHQDEKAKEPAAMLMSKELNYVNIPVPAEGKKKGIRKNDIYAGVFISPSDAWKINEKAKGELAGTLAAYAVEATFNGSNCMNSDKEKHPQSHILEKKLEREWNLTGKWWGRSTKDLGVALKAVSETPYAFAFGSLYPEMSPLVVAGAVSSATALGTPSLAEAATTEADTSAAETASSDTTATPDSSTADDAAGVEANEESSSTGKKRSKNKRRSRRNSSL